MGPSDFESLARVVMTRASAMALYARQWTDSAAAEDAVQEALSALLMEKRPPADPVAWMYHAVRNRAIDAARATSSRRRREQVVARSRSEWFETRADALMDGRSAETALRALSAEFREVVVMRIWGQLGFAQIAEVLGVSVSTVHGRYESALGRLRDVMEKPCEKKID